jgi:small redox-active disulfide protein 2
MKPGKKTPMKTVKVLGPGCKRCMRTAEMVQAEADKLGIPITIEKVTDYAAIAAFGVAATPGVVVDGKLVHAGGLPREGEIGSWLKA